MDFPWQRDVFFINRRTSFCEKASLINALDFTVRQKTAVKIPADIFTRHEACNAYIYNIASEWRFIFKLSEHVGALFSFGCICRNKCITVGLVLCDRDLAFSPMRQSKSNSYVLNSSIQNSSFTIHRYTIQRSGRSQWEYILIKIRTNILEILTTGICFLIGEFRYNFRTVHVTLYVI